MRRLLITLALACAAPAAAQTPATAPSETAQVQRGLSAIWRQLPQNPSGGPEAIFAAACEGALAELDELAAAFPAQLTPDAVRGLRTTRGLVIVAGAEPGQVFVFPSPALAGMVGGLGAFTLGDRAQGRVDLRDAAGSLTQLQLGSAGGRAVMRILRPNAGPLTFVGCAPTSD